MRALLDTHVFLWLVSDDPRLSQRAKDIFLNGDNELLLSAASGFEIAVKHSLGKLTLAEEPREFVRNRVLANALTPLPITLEHALGVAGLPFHHHDPFDRLLIAQALHEKLPLLSADSAFTAYGVDLIWR